MRFAFLSSLKPGALKAYRRGNGKYRKYVVDRPYIASIDPETGRAKDFVLVVSSKGSAICEKTKKG